MSKITLTCHKKVSYIICICGYAGSYHIYNPAINGTITTDVCSNNCEVCQKKFSK